MVRKQHENGLAVAVPTVDLTGGRISGEISKEEEEKRPMEKQSEQLLDELIHTIMKLTRDERIQLISIVEELGDRDAIQEEQT